MLRVRWHRCHTLADARWQQHLHARSGSSGVDDVGGECWSAAAASAATSRQLPATTSDMQTQRTRFPLTKKGGRTLFSRRGSGRPVLHPVLHPVLSFRLFCLLFFYTALLAVLVWYAAFEMLR